jgi:mannose-6-phosphate isomerase
MGPQQPGRTERPHVSRLVGAEHFVLDRWAFDTAVTAGGDSRCHILAVLEGIVRIDGDPTDLPLTPGGTALLPAASGTVQLIPEGKAVLLDAYLP